MYEIARFNGEIAGIRRLADGAFIPIDDNNPDYCDYLKWAAKKGNKVIDEQGE